MKCRLIATAISLTALTLVCGLAVASGGGNSGATGGAGSGSGGGGSTAPCTTIQKDIVSASTSPGDPGVQIRSAVTTTACGSTGGTGWVTITNLDTNRVEFTEGEFFATTYSVNLDYNFARFNTNYRVDFVTYAKGSTTVTDRRTITLVTPAF
jgi:hypothetical protein